MSSIKRTPGLLFLLGAVSLGLAAATDSPLADAGENGRGPIVKRLEVDQRGWSLHIAITTRSPIRARGLAPQPSTFGLPGRRHACVRIAQRGRRTLACFGSAEQGGLRLVAARVGKRDAQRGRRWTATRNVSRRGARTVRARVPFNALGLQPGGYRIGAVTTWSAPECSNATAGVAARDPVCRSAKPRSGFRSLRVRRPWIGGCSASGPSPVRAGSRSRRRVALTFDDGPGAYTGRVLDILARHDAQGTFFVVGSQISGRTALLRRMLRDGHVVANHTWNHEFNASASSLAATSRRVREATGFTPCSFRPPGGVLSGRLVSDALRLDMTTVMWDVDPQDWRTPGSAAIRSRVLAAARPGSIVLLHDGGGERSQTVAALPGIIAALAARGYRLVTVPELLRQPVRWRP